MFGEWVSAVEGISGSDATEPLSLRVVFVLSVEGRVGVRLEEPVDAELLVVRAAHPWALHPGAGVGKPRREWFSSACVEDLDDTAVMMSAERSVDNRAQSRERTHSSTSDDALRLGYGRGGRR